MTKYERKLYMQEYRKTKKGKEYQKEYRLKNIEKTKEYNKEYRLKNIEYYNQYIKEYQKEYNKNNKEKLTQYRKEYNKKYRLKNKEKLYQLRKEWKKNKPLFKLKCNIRTNIANSIKKQGYTKNSKIYKILCCTYEEFKQHLEKQFTKGMTWENQGKWHLDHIYPISLAKDEEEVIRLNHYTNFQPLWAIDNIKKGNKIIDNTQLKLI